MEQVQETAYAPAAGQVYKSVLVLKLFPTLVTVEDQFPVADAGEAHKLPAAP